jgi:hypothetical protein
MTVGLFTHLSFGLWNVEVFGLLVLLALRLVTEALAIVVAATDAIERTDEGEDALLAAVGNGLGEGGDEKTAQGEGLSRRTDFEARDMGDVWGRGGAPAASRRTRLYTRRRAALHTRGDGEVGDSSG